MLRCRPLLCWFAACLLIVAGLPAMAEPQTSDEPIPCHDTVDDAHHQAQQPGLSDHSHDCGEACDCCPGTCSSLWGLANSTLPNQLPTLPRFLVEPATHPYFHPEQQLRPPISA